MLIDNKRQQLNLFLKDLCEKHAFEHAYIAQKIGKRRHFIAGYGKENFTHTNRIDINGKIVFFWQGCSKILDMETFMDNLISIVKQLELM
ncbi:MAG: hypothetical protein RBU23_13075 [Candidatus Auribacterota bacterium]|jgi:hypothetical protein|nr:hypothetical protein [Candidatus Auribacterota bacterium]